MAAAAVVGGVIAVAGIALNVAANEEEAELRQNQADESAYLKDLQAKEILSRLQINLEAVEDEAESIEKYGLARVGASGADSSGTLAFLTDTQIALRKKIYNMSRDASFNAFTLQREAYAQRKYGVMIDTAANYNNAATVLQGGATIANSFAGSQKSSATSLSGES